MESFFVVYLSFSLPIVFNITNNVACRTGNGRSNGSYNNDHWSVPYGVPGGSFDLVLAIDISVRLPYGGLFVPYVKGVC